MGVKLLYYFITLLRVEKERDAGMKGNILDHCCMVTGIGVMRIRNAIVLAG